MTLLENIIKLRKRINEFREQNPSLHSATVYDCCSVEMALCLAELGVIRQREISKEEEHWFNGQRFIDDSFRGWPEWSDIFDLYYDLVEEVKSLKYFKT